MPITPESGNSRQRGLFNDAEVGTEAHDDILAWVVSSAGRQAISRPVALAPIAATCDFRGHVAAMTLPEGHPKRFIENCERYVFFPSSEGFRVSGAESSGRLEVPMQGKNGYFVGFADAIIQGHFTLTVPGILYALPAGWRVNLPQRRDLVNAPHRYTDGDVSEHFKILVEVKTGRLQLGEVLRQLNTYKTLGTFSHRLLIVKQCPPAHYLEALQGEGIHVALFSDYSLEWLTGEA